MRTLAIIFLIVSTIQIGCVYCEKVTCADDEFFCADGERCIGKGLVCDDYPNCLDHSDEKEELCKTWEYEYKDDPDTGGWFGGWGGGDYDYDYENEIGETDDKEKEKEKEKKEVKEVEEIVKENCSIRKCEASGPLSFESDKKYRYKYEVLSKTQSTEPNNNHSSSIFTTADVEIDAITACEMSLKLKNVDTKYSTVESKGNPMEAATDDPFIRALEKENLRFSMIGGEVDQLCSSLREDARVLNFKRGILSMIQNTMPKLDLHHTKVEKDVIGECEMQYDFKWANNPSTFIVKTRNIPTCRDRSHISSSIHSVPYEFPEDTKTLPIIDSTSFCEQELRKGVILSSNCQEEHQVIPLSSDKGKISTSISQKLTFDSKTFASEKLGPVEKRSDILFDHHEHLSADGRQTVKEKYFDGELAVVTELLNHIADSDQDENENYSVAKAFRNLVVAMRTLDLQQLSDLFDNRNWDQKETDKKAFVSALPMIGTSASIRFMGTKKIALEDNILESLSFIHSPDLEVIVATSELFDAIKVPSSAYLAIGSLLNNYCEHNSHCSSQEPVRNVLNRISSTIPANCKIRNTRDKISILHSMRSLGNAGSALNDDIYSKLDECILNDIIDMEYRTTAIEAFRRTPCNETRSSFEIILMDSTEDSELRIQSYLALLRCPKYETIRLIEHVLSIEEVNQVGSFIWTHLKNIQESSSTSKIELQSLISNREFEEKFKSDFRKYSRNIEWSGFYDELNIGATMDSNIIFSQKSYVPRSTSFNFTADLFGRSLNIFEVHSRFEGFEKEIAKLLGDFSAFDNNPVDGIKNKYIREAIIKSDRAEKYLEEAAEISLGLKLFGDDVSFHHISGIENIMKYSDHLNPMKFLESMKTGKEFNLQKSWIPLDSSYQLPTSAGLPLKVTLEGSANVDVAARIQGDLMSMLSINQSIKSLFRKKTHYMFTNFDGNFEGYLKPKVSIDLKASMIVDGHSAQSGIELHSSFSSSTVIDCSLQLDGTKAVSFDVNIPKNNMELLKVSSKLVMVHYSSQIDSPNDSAGSFTHEIVENEIIPPIEMEECSPNLLLLKSQICWNLKYPQIPETESNSRILSYGPAEYSVIYKKTDPTMKGYTFRYHWGIKDKNLVATLLFDTPGATISSAKFGFNLIVDYSYKGIAFDLNLPRRSISAKGQYVWDRNEKKIDLALSFNGESDTSLVAGYKIYEEISKRIVIPTMKITRLGRKLLEISGDLEEKKKNSHLYSVDLKFEADFDGKSTGTIRGNVDRKYDQWDAVLDVEYSLASLGTKESVAIRYNRIAKNPEEIGGKRKMERTWRIAFTHFPHLNCRGKLSTMSFAGSIENGLEISLGRYFENPDHKVSIYQNFIFYGGDDQTTFNSMLSLKYPKNKLDIKIGADYYQDIRDINTGFIFQYAEGRAMKSRFHKIERFSSGPYEMEADWLLDIPNWINITVKGNIKETGPKSYDFDLDIIKGENTRIEFTGHYNDLSTRLRMAHNLELKIKLPSRDVIYTLSSFRYDNTQLVVECQVKMKSSMKYKVRVAYINQLDHLSAHQRKIEIDVSLPNQIYYWHSEITFGEFITISNDIHIDRYRDLNLWLQIRREYEGSRRIEAKFLWDANRDPTKKAEIEAFLNANLLSVNSSVTFLGNEYQASWQSLRKYNYDEKVARSNWHQDHSGKITWKDNDRKLHEIRTGVSFTLDRGSSSAEFDANSYLETPFNGWKRSFVDIKYARDLDRIEASLKSEWHEHEFINMNLKLTKNFDDRRNFKCETKFEVLSSLEEHFISLSSGAKIEKLDGKIDGNIFFQWDEDKAELSFEARDNSGPKDWNLLFEAKILTTLKDYKSLTASADFTAMQGSFALLSSAAWEELIYKVDCRGELLSANEYLKGEVLLKTPNGDVSDATARIRVFYDPVNRDENLQIIGRWSGKEVKLDGKIAAQPKDFRAELMLETPFAKLSEASIILGHSLKDHYKTAALVKWNKTKTIGLEIESRMNSLSDFLMSITVMTPIAKYKEIRAEIRNFFLLENDVRVNSRIFGQLNDLKYGIGTIYEQGTKPRLVVGLELYTPILDLEEVSFNIADRSVQPLMKYVIDIKYGQNRDMNVATEFSLQDESFDMKVSSNVNLESLLGETFKSSKFESEMKIDWVSGLDCTTFMAASTSQDTYKIFIDGFLDPDGENANIELNLALPVDFLQDLDVKIDYKKMSNWNYGFVKIIAISGEKTVMDVYVYGTLRDLSISFDLPIEKYGSGSFAYKLLSQDIIKSKLVSTLTLGKSDFTYALDGLVYVDENNYITRMELDMISPEESSLPTKIIVHGKTNKGEGFRNFVKIIHKEIVIYEGEISYDLNGDNNWNVDAHGTRFVDGAAHEHHEGKITFKNVRYEPLLFDFEAKTRKVEASETEQEDFDISLNFNVQKEHWPYEASLVWHLSPLSTKGSWKILVESFKNERVACTVEVAVKGKDDVEKTFKLVTDLDNRSTGDVVNLGLLIDLSSNLGVSESEPNHLLVNGTLRQITADEVGVLIVHVEWPNMKPVTFSAEANYVDVPSLDVRTSIVLDLTDAKYGFIGQVLRPGPELNIDSALWWKREGDLNQKKVKFTTNISFQKGGNLSGKSVLRLPMVEGLEVSTADFTYEKINAFNDVSLVITAAGMTNRLNAVYKINELPAIEGNLTLSSSMFREGRPINIRFKQSITSKGYYGNYNFEYPTYDYIESKYKRESVTASLQHNSLVDGHEGVFEVTSVLTKSKPLKFIYSFRFPNRPFVSVKLGIVYEKIHFELRVEHSVTYSLNSQMRKTLVELDNIIWPFGIAYTKTETTQPLGIKEVTNEIKIYDLEDTTRNTTIKIIRNKTAKGGRFAIVGALFGRGVELSTNYVYLPKHKRTDVLVSWAPDQEIVVELDWQERSNSPDTKDQILVARIAHPLRILTFNMEMTAKAEETTIEIDFDTNTLSTSNGPLKAVINVQKLRLSDEGKHYKALVSATHPALERDIDLNLELGTNHMQPLLFKLIFKYSKDARSDLSMKATVEKDVRNNRIANNFEVIHQKSNLLARSFGYVSYGGDLYSFIQNLIYTSHNGTESSAKIHGGLNLHEKTLRTQVEASERIVDLNMKIEEKEPGFWKLYTTSETHENLPFTTSLRVNPTKSIFILTIDDFGRKNVTTSIDTVNPDYLRYNAEKIIIEGGYEDERYLHFTIKHHEPSTSLGPHRANVTLPPVKDADFALKLNHSRLLTAHFNWRKRIEMEIENEISELVGISREIRDSAKQYVKELVKVLSREITNRTKPIVADLLLKTSPIVQFYRNESRSFKDDLIFLFKNIEFTNKEKKLFNSIQYTAKNLIQSLEKLSFIQKLKKRLSEGSLRSYIIKVVEKIRTLYQQLLLKKSSTHGIIAKIKELLTSLASVYDQAAKKWYLLFRNALNDFNMKLRNWLRTKWHNVYNNYKPHILKTLHLIESASYNIANKLWKYMNKLGADIKSLSYIQTLQQMYYKIKSIYDEMSNRTLRQNLEMVYNYAVSSIENAAQIFMQRVLPFMEDWKNEVKKAWNKLYSYESAKDLIDFSYEIFKRVQWLVSKFDARDAIVNISAFAIEHGYTILSQTAIQAHMRHISAKTEMTWTPDEGNVRLSQKLPFEWIALNQSPEINELFYIPVITPVKQWLFPSTKFSVLDTWYRFFNLNFYPSTWIPPFAATGYVIGEDHLITFDGALINFKGSCEHILAVDLIKGNWAITIKYQEYAPKTINIYQGKDRIEFSKNFKVKINDKLIVLPNSLRSSMIWRTAGAINLEMISGLRVSWNSVHDVVAITVPKTSFLNTAGLLGTNNNEPSDDLVTPGGRHTDNDKLEMFFESWNISPHKCKTKESLTRTEPLDAEKGDDGSDICKDLFNSTTSPFKYCFYQVDPAPYYDICLRDLLSQNVKHEYQESILPTRSAALAYRERCNENSVPVKLPVDYIRCEYLNATTQKVKSIQEGQTVTLHKQHIYNNVDVVLLVEMNSCNGKRLQSKQFHRFIAEFDAGLLQEGVNSARYAVVAYGGQKPYSEPSLVTTDADIFTSSKNVAKSLQNLQYPENLIEVKDSAFDAITFASNLGFRSPVDVVFLLFPCKPCQQSYGLDYSTMYHILLNNAATLHVFKEDYFDIEKKSLSNKILGYDKDVAFTVRDYKKKKMGGTSLKKQISPPKQELSWCLPLAIETGGSVFTSKALSGTKKKLSERLGKVMGRMVGATSVLKKFDQHCLCLSTQEVTPILRCDKWDYGDFSVLERYGLEVVEVGESSNFFTEQEENF